jgi:hypothetical protein
VAFWLVTLNGFVAGEVVMSRWSHVAIIATLVAYPAAAQEGVDRPVQWKKSDGGSGHRYQAVLVPAGINWVEAQLRAAARGCGWHLATITSEAEDDFVYSLISGREEFFGITGIHCPWLGGFQRNATEEPDGEWRWVTEEAFEFTNWFDGEPNNTYGGPPELGPGVPIPNSEDFLHYVGLLGDIPSWNDLPVNALLTGYILERESCGRRR